MTSNQTVFFVYGHKITGVAEKDIEVFDTIKYTKVIIQFHCTCAQNDYNCGIEKVDIAGQYRSYYTMYH